MCTLQSGTAVYLSGTCCTSTGHRPRAGLFVSARLRQKFAATPARQDAHARRMDKLQRSGRAFLIRVVAKHGLAGAARVLRALADDLDALVGE
jgi:hypothetical protein